MNRQRRGLSAPAGFLFGLALADAGKLGPADRARTLGCRAAVLERHLGGVLYLSLGATLHAIRFHVAPFLFGLMSALIAAYNSAANVSVNPCFLRFYLQL